MDDAKHCIIYFEDATADFLTNAGLALEKAFPDVNFVLTHKRFELLTADDIDNLADIVHAMEDENAKRT